VIFRWFEEKRQANIRKHGIDFVDVPKVFAKETITVLDERYEYDERRYITFGVLRGRVIAIAHTETDQIIRIISARKATRNEEGSYFKEIKD
jgi:uncharacterized protein